MKIAFTIATPDYLAQAKTLADTLVQHNPEYGFKIILIDNAVDAAYTTYVKPYEIIGIEKISIPKLQEMHNRYTIFELSNAIKPFIAEYLFEHNPTIDALLYLDSDIAVYHSFEEAEKLLQNNQILLTPHFSTPLVLDNKLLTERSFLNAGIYNGGFFALVNGNETSRFLQWWKERLIDQCKMDFCNGMFVDQLWLNFVPVYFKQYILLTQVGYNVAYWNFHERQLSMREGKYFVNEDSPLVFFHFSGYDFSQPDIISRHQNRFTFQQRPDVVELFKEYREQVLLNNYEELKTLKSHYVLEKEEAQRIEEIRQMREAEESQKEEIERLKQLRAKIRSEIYKEQKLEPTLRRYVHRIKRLFI